VIVGGSPELFTMPENIASFYSPLAEHYHLIFEDWDQSIDRQARILNPLLASEVREGPLKILDCACGIGTQAIGFATYGHQVVASDVSPGAIARAIKEAERRCQRIAFHVSDMTSLAEVEACDFDVVAALDNALPHLAPTELGRALAAIASKLEPNGLFLASIRDYDRLMPQRPALQGPVFYGGEGARRIVLQVWDWIDDRIYTLHQYITQQSGAEWITHHFVSEYRCLLRDELTAELRRAGFNNVQWLLPAESGYYQPLVLARLQ
jgi:SAM-dependent methyltransferase